MTSKFTLARPKHRILLQNGLKCRNSAPKPQDGHGLSSPLPYLVKGVWLVCPESIFGKRQRGLSCTCPYLVKGGLASPSLGSHFIKWGVAKGGGPWGAARSPKRGRENQKADPKNPKKSQNISQKFPNRPLPQGCHRS